MRQATMTLRKVDQVAGLPAAEAEELAEVSELRCYADGAGVFSQGEPMPGVFLVLKGGLRVFRTDRRGKSQVIDLLQPGACVGGIEVFDGGAASTGAVAMGDTECWLIAPVPLQLLASRSSTWALWLIRHFAGNVRHLVSLVESLSLHTVPERVARLVLDYPGRTPGRAVVEFKETQEDSAQRLGTSREAFSRALRLLADLGLIRNSFPVVRILDAQELQRYADQGWARPTSRERRNLAEFSLDSGAATGPEAAPWLLQSTAQ